MEKLKTFTQIGAKNKNGDIIIPANYTDIERIDNYLVIDANKNITLVKEPIYLAYRQPFYDIYTLNGKIECPFEIKFYCVQRNTLIGLEDSDGYWNIICIDQSNSKLEIIYDNLRNIESAAYNHIVCRQTNDLQFVYSLSKKEVVIPPLLCGEIILHPEGIIINKYDIGEVYNYNGEIILSDNYKLSVISGIIINSHQLILAKNKFDFYGLYSFTGKCILPCNYIDIQFNKHHCNRHEFITLNVSTYQLKKLLYLDFELNTRLIASCYSGLELFDCGRLVLLKNNSTTLLPEPAALLAFSEHNNTLSWNTILTADRIEGLYDGSCKHFAVWKNKKVGVANLQGKLIIPIKYKKVYTDTWHEKIYAEGYSRYIRIFKI